MRHDRVRLSIIIPVGPGDAIAPELRQRLSALPGWAEVIEVRVSGAEATKPCVSAHWRILVAAPGRSSQQNAGVIAAQGDYLWLLHADSLFERAALAQISHLIEQQTTGLWYFDLRFLQDGPSWMWLNTVGAWVRSRCFGLPFGDQGFLLRSDEFARLGGFDETLKHGEDHEMIWRARRQGLRIQAIGLPLHTSARRYAAYGWWQTTLRHLRATHDQVQRFARRGAPQ